jgi:hypothetical protein
VSLSRSPSTAAVTIRLTTSSRGRARRSSAMAWPYAIIPASAAMASSACCRALGLSAPISALLHSKMRWRSSRGMPNRSASTRNGSSAATSITRSNSPPRPSRMSRAFACTERRSRSTERGVKMGWRMRRRRVCCGWSMLSMIWRNSARLSSASVGRKVPPTSEEKRSWSRSTSLTRAWDVTAQKPGLSTNCSIGLSPMGPGHRRLDVPGDAALAPQPVEGVVGRAVPERPAHRQVALHPPHSTGNI